MDVLVKKIIVYIAATIIIISASFFAGSITTKHRLMAEYRQQIELSRERAAVLTDTLTRAREEVGAIGESLSRQRTSVAELRELISEVKTRYENMENLLNSLGDNNCYIWSSNSCINSSNGE